MRRFDLFAALFLLGGGVLAQGMIPISPFSSTYSTSSGYTRGLFFQAPVNLVITGLRVPDEAAKGFQYVAVYKLASAPPVYTASVPATPIFYRGDLPSAAVIPCALAFNAGDFVCVLAACGTSQDNVMFNSYGAGPAQSSVLGNPVTLTRFIMQTSIRGNQGVGNVSASSGSIGRVEIYVRGQVGALNYGAGNNAFGPQVPSLDTTAAPVLGAVGTLNVQSGDPTATAAIVVLGIGRAQLPIGFGTLLSSPPFYATFAVPGAGGLLNLPIPNAQVLLGAGPLNFQAFALLPAGVATSNGTEWFLGL